MNVILLEKVRNLGQLGDEVKVKSGYGRNFLLPSGKAVMATKANVERFQAQRADLEKRADETLKGAEKRRDQLVELGSVTISVKAGDEGRLFGSVSAADVADAINAAGVEVAKREVNLPNGPVRELGESQFTVHLHTDIDQEMTLNVEAE